MKVLYYFFVFIEVLTAIFILLPTLLLLLHYLLKLFAGDRSPLHKKPRIQKDFHFAAIVTAHQDTRFIPPLVDSLLRQTMKE